MAESWGYAVAHLDEEGEVLDWFEPISGEHQLLTSYDEAVAKRGDLDPEWWSIVEIRRVEAGSDD